MPGIARAPKVVCFGFVVIDRVYELDSLPDGDGKFTATAYRETGGGIAGTAAVAIAALGGDAAYCGAVGDDPAGDWLRNEMQHLNVDVGAVRRVAGGRTPSSCVLVDTAGERCLIVDRGSATPDPGMAAVLLGRAQALLVDHRFPAAAAALLDGAPLGLARVLDAEDGTRADLASLVARADYPIFSRNGLRVCTGETDPERGLRRVAAPDARALAVTLGEAGSLWLIAGVVHHVPAPRVPLKDTTGCGDVFHGAFALAVAEGRAPLTSARFATAVAALKAKNGAGWRGMPDRSQVASLLADAW